MDPARNVYESGYVWIRGDRIHAVGPMTDVGDIPEDAKVRSFSNDFVIMPGLVNTHDHLSQAVARGGYDEHSRENYGTDMFAALRVLDGPASYAGAAASLLELILGGVTTTTCDEFGHPDRPDGVLAACRESKARVIFARSTMDNEDSTVNSQAIPEDFRETPERAIAEVERLRQEYDSDRISVHPGALSVLRVTDSMLKELRGYANDQDLILLMHLGAAQDEQDEGVRRHGRLLVEHLADIGVLNSKSLLAHGTWTEQREVSLLADSGTAVSSCPITNAVQGERISNLAEWLRADIRVGLGTDGSATGNGQNLWEVGKGAVFMQKTRLSPVEFGSAELGLELITVGGARAVYMEDQIGSLEAGKLADVICIDANRPALVPRSTIVSNLLYSNDRDAVRHVYVGGEEVVRDGEHLGWDREAVCRAATDEAVRFLRDSGREAVRDSMSRFVWS